MKKMFNDDEPNSIIGRPTSRSKLIAPITIALGYFLVGILWILFSDRVLAVIAPTPEVYARWQTLKGWGYVLVTAILLYSVVRLFSNRWQQVEDALRASEEKYRLHFENVSDVIYSINRDFEIVSISPSVEDVLGYAPAALIGKPIRDLDLLTPASKQVALADARRVLVHGHRDPSIYEFIGKDGTRKLGEVNGSPLIQDNEITGVVSVARDVTERVAMERQLHQQARLAAVGQLAAGIAHDFRNLLTTIILYAEMALRQPEISQGLADKLKVIIGESHKATDLVQQILDFSIRGTISTRPLDLADRVGEVAAILRRTLPESIRFAIHTEPDPIVVRADPGRLQQVLTNLALNARDAMPEGGTLTFDITTLTVRDGGIPPVAKMKPGPWACLAVQDTGKGMTEEVQAHLFEPFFTTKEAGEGTGLGLAQVYGIIRQHEGAIDIDSAVGEGTTVRVYLPLSTDGEPEMAPPSTEAPRGRGETILLVEDQKKLRAAASALLRSLGYVVHTAANGREALAVYQTLREQAQGIDLVVSDVVMPEMSGQALAESLKALDPSIKMLAITGYPLGEVQSQLRSLGFEEVVGKPLDADSFAHAVRRSLSKTPTGAAENRREE